MSKINAVELYTENGITLYDVNGVVMTTTESIANKFGKDKGKVDDKLKSFPDYIQLIELAKIGKSETVGSSKVTTFINRDVMTLLIMGFTGNKAYEWKKQYIEAFNLMEAKLTQPQLSFNERKMQMINDVAQKAIEQISALEDDTKSLQPPKPEEEVIEAIEYIAKKKEIEKVKKHYRHQTESKYYNLKVTSIYKLKAINPKDYILTFDYYTENQCIITTGKGRSFKIPSPRWLRDMGDFESFKAKVTYRRSRNNRKGFLDLVGRVKSIKEQHSE